MPHHKSCPVKFGVAINAEGVLMEIPCSGKDCAWYLENCCAVLSIARGLCAGRKQKKPKGIVAY